MKILIAHNRYQQPGGEDAVFDHEMRLLQEAGHSVTTLTEDNRRTDRLSPLSVGVKTIWSIESHRRMEMMLRADRPDVVHLHNTFPLLSPSVIQAARRQRVPVVQTLHNYRLICPAATLFRSGRPCDDCIGKVAAYPGVLHRCYHNSFGASAAVMGMLIGRRLAGGTADRYIALTEFARSLFVRGGLPADRITVKANSYGPDPGVGDGAGGYFLYAGRLTVEKGIEVLLEAWGLAPNGMRLMVLGDGPLWPKVQEAARANPSIEATGQASHAEVLKRMKEATALVVPSLWFEGLPVVLAEAFASGLPVIASDIGSLSELIVEGRNGLLVPPGDPSALMQSARSLHTEGGLLARLRRGARQEYEAKYTDQRNLRALLQIYREAIESGAVGSRRD
jgi:glycosyltransferase involved in cell wall biosynthesis